MTAEEPLRKLNQPTNDSSDSAGLRRTLKNRHIQLIALGGAIGTGLFYGAAESISKAGPAILISYSIGGLVIFLIMRALGEMSVHTPSSGAFSYYAYKNLNEYAGFVSGWNYWFNYIAVSMAELSVVGLYIQFWIPQMPSWISSAIFLLIITAINLISVKAYGEFEFWFAIIKVIAIICMIVFGLSIIIFGFGNGGAPTGISNLWVNDGFMPHGMIGLIISLVVIMFSFGGIELIGITAGEADNPKKTIPKAINQVIYRILIFYIGSLFVILCLFPWNKLNNDESPFVSIFAKLGIAGAATILNVVVLTATMSAYNSGLYSNSRMLYSLAKQHNAPKLFGTTNRFGTPWKGVIASSLITALTVLLNYLYKEKVFPYVMSVALMAGIINWAMITITQLAFRKRIGPKRAKELQFKMPGYPYTNYFVLVFLAGMVVVMYFVDNYHIAPYVGLVWLAILSVAYAIKAGTPKKLFSYILSSIKKKKSDV